MILLIGALAMAYDALFVSQESKERDADGSARVVARNPSDASAAQFENDVERAKQTPMEELGIALFWGVVGMGLVVWGLAKSQAESERV